MILTKFQESKAHNPYHNFIKYYKFKLFKYFNLWFLNLIDLL